MTEQKVEQRSAMVCTYLDRVEALYRDVQQWCTTLGLIVTQGTVELNEEGLPRYDAPCLHIARDGAHIADLVPAGASVIGAQGRVDLVGRIARQALLFQIGKGPTISKRTVVDGKTTDGGPERPMIPGINGDGWYWLEPPARRAKHVDETLFGDLLRDVSDYDLR
ncbi:MAG: hypothetical protein JO171_17695 [Paludibacterium sp.]|uniref:hypothetical protein n=1 Tax=Paludibacterium sp. TaxID=1917523 RepID=UPI0025EDA599|nr:hypothetical protein [Paludibacterium sp.]MBV8048987.1 hypothetical protein [Paludibacterium sp.]MBV8647496.1 hypothetical protein [Paludibacterium sp.]